MSLKDKIYDTGLGKYKEKDNVLQVEDVKESVKELKEEIVSINFTERSCCSAMKENEGFNICDICVGKAIDKVFGFQDNDGGGE